MYRYSSYIARSVAHSTVLTALSLTSIVWLTQALRLMDFIVNQGIGLDIFLLLTVLALPALLTMVLPIALFCASAFVYHKLKNDSELVVMEAAGLSRFRLVKPAVYVAGAVTLIGYMVAFYVMPVAHTQFREMQNFLRNNYVSVLLQEGVFSTPVDGLTVFVRERDSEGVFKGILVHDNRDSAASTTMMAEEGKLESTPQGQRFLLTNGNRQEMRQGRLSLLYFERYGLDLSQYTKEGADRERDPRELTMRELLVTHGVPDAEVKRRRGELHQRILWPFYAFTLTLAGLAVMLTGEFSRRGSGKRVLSAVIVVALLAFAAIGVRNLVTQNSVYLVLAYANALVPAVLALYHLADRMPKASHQGDAGPEAR